MLRKKDICAFLNPEPPLWQWVPDFWQKNVRSVQETYATYGMYIYIKKRALEDSNPRPFGP